MTNFTTINSTAPAPSTAAHPHVYYVSPLTAGLCLLALVTITMISYTFFKATRNIPLFRWSPAAPPPVEASCKSARNFELVGGVKYRKMASVGGGEACPVCLSALAQGEEIGELSACKHAFHAACVDMWLQSHSSCPVCRAAVRLRRSNRLLADGEDDFRHG